MILLSYTITSSIIYIEKRCDLDKNKSSNTATLGENSYNLGQGATNQHKTAGYYFDILKSLTR